MDKLSFDDIRIDRPELAASYAALLRAQPGRPLALFAPRQVGKTHFLDHDLAPLARAQGLAPVYADLWLQQAAPLDAINHALEEALDDANVPASALGKIGRTAVKKIGAASVRIDLGDAPMRRALPTRPELRLDALVTRVAAASGKPVLLMLDEVQTLGESKDGATVAAALRAVLHKRREQVMAVLTGSSQSGLAQVFTTAGAPMYQFAQLVTFPVLGDAYLKKLSDRFHQVHRKRPLLDDLRRMFASIGHKPALMKDLVKTMSGEGLTDVDRGLALFLRDERHVAGWRALLGALEPIDRAVLGLIARGAPPLGAESLAELGQRLGAPVTLGKVRASIERLRRAALLDKHADQRLRIDDQMLQAYVLALGKTPTTNAGAPGS